MQDCILVVQEEDGTKFLGVMVHQCNCMVSYNSEFVQEKIELIYKKVSWLL